MQYIDKSQKQGTHYEAITLKEIADTLDQYGVEHEVMYLSPAVLLVMNVELLEDVFLMIK